MTLEAVLKMQLISKLQRPEPVPVLKVRIIRPPLLVGYTWEDKPVYCGSCWWGKIMEKLNKGWRAW